MCANLQGCEELVDRNNLHLFEFRFQVVPCWLWRHGGRIPPQAAVIHDLTHNRWLFLRRDQGDHLHLAATSRTRQRVRLVHASDQRGPTQTGCFAGWAPVVLVFIVAIKQAKVERVLLRTQPFALVGIPSIITNELATLIGDTWRAVALAKAGVA